MPGNIAKVLERFRRVACHLYPSHLWRTTSRTNSGQHATPRCSRHQNPTRASRLPTLLCAWRRLYNLTGFQKHLFPTVATDTSLRRRHDPLAPLLRTVSRQPTIMHAPTGNPMRRVIFVASTRTFRRRRCLLPHVSAGRFTLEWPLERHQLRHSSRSLLRC